MMYYKNGSIFYQTIRIAYNKRESWTVSSSYSWKSVIREVTLRIFA